MTDRTPPQPVPRRTRPAPAGAERRRAPTPPPAPDPVDVVRTALADPRRGITDAFSAVAPRPAPQAPRTPAQREAGRHALEEVLAAVPSALRGKPAPADAPKRPLLDGVLAAGDRLLNGPPKPPPSRSREIQRFMLRQSRALADGSARAGLGIVQQRPEVVTYPTKTALNAAADHPGWVNAPLRAGLEGVNARPMIITAPVRFGLNNAVTRPAIVSTGAWTVAALGLGSGGVLRKELVRTSVTTLLSDPKLLLAAGRAWLAATRDDPRLPLTAGKAAVAAIRADPSLPGLAARTTAATAAASARQAPAALRAANRAKA